MNFPVANRCSDNTVEKLMQQWYCSSDTITKLLQQYPTYFLLHKSGPRPQIWHNEKTDLSSPTVPTLRKIFHHLSYANQWECSFPMINVAIAKTLGSTNYPEEQMATHLILNNKAALPIYSFPPLDGAPRRNKIIFNYSQKILLSYLINFSHF